MAGVQVKGLFWKKVEQLSQGEHFLLIEVLGLDFLVEDLCNPRFQFGKGSIGEGTGLYQVAGVCALRLNVSPALFGKLQQVSGQLGLEVLVCDFFTKLGPQLFVLSNAPVPDGFGCMVLLDPASSFKYGPIGKQFPSPLPLKGVGGFGVCTQTAGEGRQEGRPSVVMIQFPLLLLKLSDFDLEVVFPGIMDTVFQVPEPWLCECCVAALN